MGTLMSGRHGSRRVAAIAALAAGLAANFSTPAVASGQEVREALWVGRLGADTVVVEASRRTGPLIEGTIVNVAAGLLVQRYEADVDERGRVRALRSWTIPDLENPPGPGVTPTLSVEIGADSIRVSRATPDGPQTSAVPAVEGAVPVFDAFFNNPMALTDLAFRGARTRGDDALRLYYVGSPAVEELPLESAGDGGLSYDYVLAKQYPMMAGARLHATVDAEGLARFDARETTFKIVTDREPWSDPLVLAREFRARGLGAGGMSGMSPPRTASGRIGAVDVEVTYGQPSRRGRRIFPDVVPFGLVWRAGANAATEIRFGADVLVAGRAVPAGSYSVWVIPGESVDTLILSRATRIWGVMYDPEQDLVRVPLERERLDDPVEALTYTITSQGGAGRLELAWDDRRFGVAIEPAGTAGETTDEATRDGEGAARIRPGDIVVANLSSHVVSVYDGDTGAYRGPAFDPGAGGLANATGVAFGPDGRLYVGSAGSGQVLRYDGATGEFVDVFAAGAPLAQPFSLIFGPDGDLYVSAGPAVLRYAPDGSFVGYAARDSSLVQPIGLAIGPDGLLYVVNSTAPAISRFDPDSGELVDVIVSDSLAFPSDVAFGPDGDLYVSNAAASRVIRFDAETGAFEAVVAKLPDQGVPMGLAFRGSRLIIGDFGKGRLFFLDAPAPLREVAREGLHGPENLAVRPDEP